MIARITSGFWISAFRMRMDARNVPVYIRAKGDPTAGAIIVKIDALDGNARAYARAHDLDGVEEWTLIAEGPDKQVDESLNRQQSYDPDLWIIEIEDRSGEPPFTIAPSPR